MTDRQGFIGGSDVAAILGVSPYGSPWSVWVEKVSGETAERSDEMEERLAIGKDAERFLADVFNRHHKDALLGVNLHQYELTSPEYPWLRGHADGFVETVFGDHYSEGGWEAKTDRSFVPWDEVPAYYQCQAQTYMLLSGLDHWWFTVGFAGWVVKHYVVAADAEDQALIVKATEAFWNDHVLTGIPPEADAHPATTAAIKRHWNTPDPDDVVWANDETHALIAALKVAKADAKALDDRVTELENRLKVRMADCGELRYGDQTLATWKPQDRTSIDVAALREAHPEIAEQFTKTTTSRVLRLKTPKGK